MKITKLMLSLMVALLLTFSIVATTEAANPTISITVTARVVSISNTPSSWDFDLVDTNSTYETGLTCFNTTNVGNCEVDISISGSNMTGGGHTWELSDTATPGDMVYGLEVGLRSCTLLQEYYNTGDNSYSILYGDYWDAQTFTPSQQHKIAKVKLRLYRVGSPGTITVGIKATSAHLPTGDDLCAGTTDGDTLTTDTAGEWREIALGSGYTLTAGTKYAIVLRISGGSTSDCIRWRRLFDSPTYAGGNRASSLNGGSSWVTESTTDMMFEEYGDSYNVTVKQNAPYNALVENLTVDSSQQWGLKIWTPTSYDDGNLKTGDVTLVASAA